MKDRPPLANGYKVTSPDGKVSYLFGTLHLLYKVPQEIQTLIAQKKIQHIYIENDVIENDTDVPRIIRLDQGISLMGRAKGIPVTKLDCLPGNNLLKIHAEVNRFKKDDLKAYFTPQLILDQRLQDYLGPLLKDNPYFNKNYDAIVAMQNHTRDLTRVDQRNLLWKSTVLQALQQGNALIAVGISHIIIDKGYIDILMKENFILESFECTININHEEAKKVSGIFTGSHAMKEAKKLEACHSAELKPQLSVLAKGYHAKILSPLQQGELNRILKFILDNDTSNVFFENSLLLFLMKQDVRDCSIDSLLEYRLSSAIGLKKIELYVKSLFKATLTLNTLGEQRQAIFLVCLFYPELAKKLYQHFQKSSQSQATNLFIQCGFDAHEKTASLCETKAHDESTLSSTMIGPHCYFQPQSIKENKEIPTLKEAVAPTSEECEYQPLAGGPVSKMGSSELAGFSLINHKGLNVPLLTAENDSSLFEPLINRKTRYKS